MSDEIKRTSFSPARINGRFENFENSSRPGFGRVLKWGFSRKPTAWPRWVESSYKSLPKPSGPSEPLVTFVNHTTFIIQIDGLTILTDPIWSERCSPLSFVGPKRVRKPGIKLEDIPAVDLVLISHNHYDHLDVPTLKILDQKFSPLVLAGMGTKQFLKRKGLKNVEELDWWQSVSHKGHRIHFVPARHYSNRGLFDQNKMLWGGFVVETSAGNIYVAGDTGRGEFLNDVHTRFPDIQLALLPIGHYCPRWFMESFHMNPEDAVLAHKILQPKQSVGMHFGTFPLSDEGMDTPLLDLQQALQKQGVSPEKFLALDFGETIRV